MSSLSSPSYSHGALLIGGLMAFIFSGVVWVQCIVYFKLYPQDSWKMKTMVSSVWLLDLVHSTFIAVSLVFYFVTFFGNDLIIDHIPWFVAFHDVHDHDPSHLSRSIALSIEATATQTMIAHLFFAHKIFKSSNRNYFLTTPIAILAFTRFIAATITTSEMLKLKRYSAFSQRYPGWIFTLVLVLSAGVDIIITCCLFYHLRAMRRQLGTTGLVQVVDTLALYTLESGLLTCVAATTTLVCWLTMPSNLIFLGLHFIIGKLYANTLLASLNTRKELRRMGPRIISPWSNTSLPGLPFDDFPVPVSPRNHLALHPLETSYNPRSPKYNKSSNTMPPKTLEVNVQQIIERKSEEGKGDDDLMIAGGVSA
ncbi:hypothetical protein L218DRAFT_1006463 [Marasmius fiardii PR-910]|nr:hypothetical protein L218DRAFT_1006463 [Marasmius fiardii PR-910]